MERVETWIMSLTIIDFVGSSVLDIDLTPLLENNNSVF
jgi:hypothetical protein